MANPIHLTPRPRCRLPRLAAVTATVVLTVLGGWAQAQSIVPIAAPKRILRDLPVWRLDTRVLHQPVSEQAAGPNTATPRMTHAPDFAAPVNDLPAGGLLDDERVEPDTAWPAVGSTGWYPPDPDLAVGPNHVVEVVNSSVAWFNRGGSKQLQQTSSTFFSGVAQSTFLFDPKCFYDRVNGRFVILFLERDTNAQTSAVLLAVSDDADPNGSWYRYRIDAKLTINGSGYWIDYPGFGCSPGAYIVTGNMFGFTSGFGGVQFLIIPSAPLLTGQPASAVSIRDASGASVQVAEVVGGSTTTAFAVSRSGSSALRVYAIQSPETLSPSVGYSTVAVPSNSGPATDAQSTGGYTLDTVDARVFNAAWRNGRLVTAHSSTPSTGAPVAVRWYEVDTGNWPSSGTPTLVQAGLVSSLDLHYFTPAINQNAAGDIALLFSASSSTVTADIMVASRKAGDSPGAMGQPAVLRTSAGTAYSQGRWGDYFGVDVDPLNDTTFWGVGEYVASNGAWATEVVTWNVVLAPPTPPGNLAATPVSSGQINLTWDDASNETSYSVLRSPDGVSSSFEPVATDLAAGTTSYADAGLPSLTQFWYQVRAENAAGTAVSGVASATTLAPPPAVPEAPSGLTGEASSRTSVHLRWIDHADNETGFRVERSTNGKSWGEAAITGTDVREAEVTGLKSRTNYRFRVAAFNAAGDSPYTDVLTIRTP